MIAGRPKGLPAVIFREALSWKKRPSPGNTWRTSPAWDSPEGWRRFLDFVLSYADSFCLSFYTDCGPFRALSPEDFCASPWGFLSASISDWEVTDQSPVTARTPMLLLYFRLDPVTVSFLRGRRTVLDFPAARLDRGFLCFDDLAFLKAGKIFFCSCTHERFCSIDGDVHRAVPGQSPPAHQRAGH